MSEEVERLAYERWLKSIYDTTKKSHCPWNRIGKWGYPTKENKLYADTFWHYCREVWNRIEMGADSPNPVKDECSMCGEKVPDGYKMVALLEKL